MESSLASQEEFCNKGNLILELGISTIHIDQKTQYGLCPETNLSSFYQKSMSSRTLDARSFDIFRDYVVAFSYWLQP